jgi:hypothetical protein
MQPCQCGRVRLRRLNSREMADPQSNSSNAPEAVSIQWVSKSIIFLTPQIPSVSPAYDEETRQYDHHRESGLNRLLGKRRLQRREHENENGHRIAIGATVEPVAPWIFNGSTMNANS